ncbi:DUF305 domain-containing protein [Pseudomonas aeruginosa]|uniref:DUF305 domain-containing protein n=1 Tax=Pseudomonas aeruginosa TaxID=287 RepID=UPI0012D87720|nr:DUF305 domain-containing protein [Pseudomonas aeruginosa]MUI52256.1 DUF305 domain-containing protein [Pseudomonas aeruginosa]
MSNHQHSGSQHGRPYALFALNMALSLVAMYLVMFTMIDTWGDFRNNLNTLYLALTMVAPMGIIMLLTMPGMYPSKRTNLFIHAGLVAVFVLSLAGTRTQTAIDDKQFVASMVPHHSGAILMCREANLSDAELVKLCEEIAVAQRREIEQMDAIRARLSGTATR